VWNVNSTVLSVLISSVCTLLGTFAGVLVSSNLTQYRLKQLEAQVSKHNDLIDRIYKLEQGCALLDEKIKAAHLRLDIIDKRLDLLEKERKT
jgi:hypothetical protein